MIAETTERGASRRGWAPLVFGVLLLAGAAGAHATVVVNGDFSASPDPFTGWSSEACDDFFALSPVCVSPAPGDNLMAGPGPGLATLKGTDQNTSVRLFQDIVLPATATTLTFDIGWLVSSAPDLGDLVQASLLDGFGFVVQDLLSGEDLSQAIRLPATVVQDVSALGGTAVTLEFLLADFDLNPSDSLIVGNVSVQSSVQSVPEPGTLALALLVLGGGAGRRAWRLLGRTGERQGT